MRRSGAKATRQEQFANDFGGDTPTPFGANRFDRGRIGGPRPTLNGRKRSPHRRYVIDFEKAIAFMVLTNAEKQARWRDRRNALAREAVKLHEGDQDTIPLHASVSVVVGRDAILEHVDIEAVRRYERRLSDAREELKRALADRIGS